MSMTYTTRFQEVRAITDELMQGVRQADNPITKYPDEPHPDDGGAWKTWFIAKMYRPKEPVNLEWVHQCWIETKARWCA